MENIPEFISGHLFLVTALMAVICLLLWNIYGDSLSGIPTVSPAELTRLINHENALVLDIRTVADFASGHIIDAMNIPAAELAARVQELKKYRDKTVVVYCNSGATSSRSTRTLKKDGFEKICNLKGGLTAWQNANLPLSRER